MLPGPFPENFASLLPGIRMSLVVVGINHRTAPVEVRERVVFEPGRIPGWKDAKFSGNGPGNTSRSGLPL